MNPANVEAHEAQFQSIVDPEYEAKAQAAICTYFKEKHAGNSINVLATANLFSPTKFNCLFH